MALNISIEGTGVIANCDAISDTAGGTWFEEGGGTVSLSNDVFLIGGAAIGGKYASKSGVLGIDKGSQLYDFTAGTGNEAGELIYIWISATAIGTLDTLSNNALCVRISSAQASTTDTTYSDYLIAGNDDSNGWTGGWKCFVIDPTKTPTRNAGDTHANIIANVRSIGIWIDCSTSARADSFFVGGIAIGSGLRITGTSTTGWKDIVDYCTDYTTRGWGMFQEREGIYYSYGKTIIGDDTTPQAAAVSFTDSARVIQFGTSEYYTGSAWVSSMPVDSSGIVIEDDAATTNGVTTFSDGIIVGTDKGRAGSVFIGNSLMDVSLDLFGGSNANSVTTLYGTGIKGCTGAINSGNDAQHKFLSVSFAGCSQFDPVGAPVIRNCIFSETDSVDSAVLWNESIDMQYCGFIANTLGAGIEHPSSAGTPYGHVGLLFSGNTDDVLNSSGSAIIVNNSGGSNGSSSEGSAVTFLTAIDLNITVQDEATDPIENAQVAIYKIEDYPRTQLMNEDTNSSGLATQSYSGGVADIEIRVRKSSTGTTRYFPVSTLGTTGTSDFNLLITLKEDANA